jgi:two-component sensor histidine kinase
LLHGGIPALNFYPALLIIAVLSGWKEALAILVLSVTVGLYLFLPPGMYLQPVGWLLVGGLTIAIIGGLKALAQGLAEANDRQRVLFRELQHRVANTLQATAGRLEIIRRIVSSNPTDAANMLDELIRRMTASADVHRRLNDPAVFGQGLGSILHDAVATVIDSHSIKVTFDVETVELSLDQMSTITMLVIEVANNAQKHVFARNLGRVFLVSLTALPEHRVALSVKDDGPGWLSHAAGDPERKLGLSIIQGLVDRLGGHLSVRSDRGTEIGVVFPIVSPHPPIGHWWSATA